MHAYQTNKQETHKGLMIIMICLLANKLDEITINSNP